MEEVRGAAAPGDVLVATGYTVATSEYPAILNQHSIKFSVQSHRLPLAVLAFEAYIESCSGIVHP
jgi:phosphomevalonate kinase